MAFNRVALAAALLEYDNDNPASGLAPRKARESAIILGAAAAPPPPPPHQRPDIRASSVGRDGQRAQQQQHRLSGIGIIEDRGSTYGYIPGRPTEEEEEQGEMDMAEVDLSSWGLPETFLPPQQIRDQRPTYRVDTTTDHTLSDRITSPTNSTYAQNVVKSAVIASPSNRRNRKGRTVSFHDYTSVLYNHNNNDSSTPANREDSEQDPMEELAQHQHQPQDMAPYSTTVRPRSSMSVMNRGRPTSPFNAPHAASSPTTASPSFILSPTGSVAPLHVPLPPSPGQGQGHGVYQQHQIMEMVSTPTSPTRSTCEPLRHGDANPFALPAPAGRRVSRFDPKITTPSPVEMQGPAQADGAGGPSRASYNAGFRPVSQASGYFPPLIHTHDRSHRAAASYVPPLPAQQPSTISRLRPRTLLMPAPLHGVLDPTQSAPLMPSRWDTEGFSRGAKPLPPGALTRPDSFVGKLNDQEGGGNKGRPPAPFSSTRQLFRVTLAGAGVDGKMRDSHGSGYTGYEAGFMDVPPSAERDGEVGVQQYGGRGGDDDDDEGSEYGAEDYLAPRGEHDWRPETRFVQGPSLMDRLEARKAELRSKQRVFRGDNRPAMMSRSSAGPLVNLDAAVDPLTGQTSPGLQKRASLVLQDDDGRPLVRLVSHGDPTTTTTTTERPNMPPRGKSVFGVDTLWEKELRKLEAQQESERGLALQMEARRRKKGEKKAKKGKRQEGERSSEQEQEDTRGAAATDDDDATHPYTQTMHSQGRNDTGMPPSLSLGDLATALHAPFNPAQGAISNTNANPHTAVDVDDWAVGSDEDGPAAVQPRRRKRRIVGPVPVPDAASDSEDDVPLAKAFGVTRAKLTAEESDSSEDEPLSKLKSKVSNRTFDASDEDDIPLALRRAKKSGVVPAQQAVSALEDEDDMPLAQRRLRAQETGVIDPGLQQQQQQHLAMAMQHQSMMMNPMMSMYGGGVGMMGMPMMGMPSPMGMMPGGAPPFGVGGAFNNASTYPMPHAPLPPPDPKIDRWRREIEAREGSMISAPPSVVTSGGRT
ncbi:hypothetical protein QFC21_005215 [Naganishia friedmannii]|uniref:Uncharacterized protein n=1 Tax=Naganishia friedmannii TaxID=89922 RepID=A0ACC2VBE3_9TREE|nr:hypothetical protein QFC21_005215 [Naganishia friedmannii]